MKLANSEKDIIQNELNAVRIIYDRQNDEIRNLKNQIEDLTIKLGIMNEEKKDFED